MGYGDEIMATAEAREAKKKYPDSNIVIGDGKKIYPSIIYLNNPNIFQGSELIKGQKYIWIKNYINHRPYYFKSDNEKIYWNHNFSTKKGDIFFNELEIKNGQYIVHNAKKIWEKQFNKKPDYVVVIEPNIKNINYSKIVGSSFKRNSFANSNRDWGFENWQKVVNVLKDIVVFIQPFKGEVRKLKNVIYAECNFRNAVSIINNSNLFLGHHCGFSHAAAAIDKPAINIFGGWISPSITGYNIHNNIYINLPNSPCGSKIECSHCKECMSQITVEDIVSAVIKEKSLV